MGHNPSVNIQYLGALFVMAEHGLYNIYWAIYGMQVDVHLLFTCQEGPLRPVVDCIDIVSDSDEDGDVVSW